MASRARQSARQKVNADRFQKATELVAKDIDAFIAFANELKSQVGTPIHFFDADSVTVVLY